MCFDYPNTGDYAANEWAVPIDELLSSEEAAELAADADPASYRSYLVDGRLWGFPIDSATIVTAYRPDLLGAERFGNSRRLGFLPGDCASIPQAAGSDTDSATSSEVAWALICYWKVLLPRLGRAPYAEEGDVLDRDKARRGLRIVKEVHRLSIPRNVQTDHGLGFAFMRNDDRVALTVATSPIATTSEAGVPAR